MASLTGAVLFLAATAASKGGAGLTLIGGARGGVVIRLASDRGLHRLGVLGLCGVGEIRGQGRAHPLFKGRNTGPHV